jgi:hypothetical protein
MAMIAGQSIYALGLIGGAVRITSRPDLNSRAPYKVYVDNVQFFTGSDLQECKRLIDDLIAQVVYWSAPRP